MKCAAALRTRLADAAGGNSVAALALLNSGTLEFYTGAVPADVDAAATGTLLGVCTLNAADAFGAAIDDGVKAEVTAGAVASDAAADATGTATYARLKLSNGTTYGQLTVSATAGGGEVELSTVSIIAGGPINIASFVIRALEG